MQNSLVYFSTSLQANEAVISKIIRTDIIKKYEEDKELLEDVQIENQQALEMCNIYRTVLRGTMDTFSSITSNKLNTIMRFLTAITVIISVPTLIASIFGMNVQVPWQGEISGFWILIGVCVVTSAIAAFFLFKKPRGPKPPKPPKIKKSKNH